MREIVKWVYDHYIEYVQSAGYCSCKSLTSPIWYFSVSQASKAFVIGAGNEAAAAVAGIVDARGIIVELLEVMKLAMGC